jgi:cholesterol transport system auxiliary component
MKKIVLAVLPVIVLLSGCSFQKELPSQKRYAITIAPVHQSHTVATVCEKKVLKVRNMDIFSPVSSNTIYYRIGRFDMNGYTQSVWSQTPSNRVKALIVESLRKSKIFQDVESNEAFVNGDWLLQYSIEDFTQHFSEDKQHAFFRVRIHFVLMDAQNDKFIASKTQEVSIPTRTLDAFGGVQAMSNALHSVISQNVAWLYGVCQKER